ncbi:DUF2065 domain-containing protein [Minwuia thermotolerans]|uniref:DUF2065 domain-containing protein n=1 Tax=Minwuia thermotolerans TaxID=2056226 RepID=A0A2M9G2B4_9PROT|nr:DUF2065 domain-containing protein [Minwuia thermotolerans]PJK29867.1 DUF2065 domain-containing protein [Minwuia thermotolerans]
MHDLLVALALMVAIEGAAYALFPDGMRRALAVLLDQPTERIRLTGLVACIVGVGLVWLLRAS